MIPKPALENSRKQTIWYSIHAVAALASIVSMWLTWFKSGKVSRNSFETIDAIQIVGSIPLVNTISRFEPVWIFAPWLIVAGLALLAADKTKTALTINLLATVFIAVTGAFIWLKFGSFSGPVTAVVASVGVTISGVAILRFKR